ncbi:phosphohistidine phosphatase [Nocardioides aurantiacus]|uniref:Phosphohistidine phosphatase n=1 Tax=Nocardioides aurantiacus TaxID=86796 RepID=A0A3N2CT04_9ACTN|nr:phosphohistidine phosphatase [Nocardioides aurantiacus]
MVLRHARAESFAEEDHARRLTARGRRDAAAVGEWLAGTDVRPDVALVSSAARTRETWDLLTAALADAPEAQVRDDLYSASADTVLDALRAVPEDVTTVMYVGHNPTAASLAQALEDGEPDVEAFVALSRGFPPGAAAVLRVPVAWSDLDAAGARLVDFHAPVG